MDTVFILNSHRNLDSKAALFCELDFFCMEHVYLASFSIVPPGFLTRTSIDCMALEADLKCLRCSAALQIYEGPCNNSIILGS